MPEDDIVFIISVPPRCCPTCGYIFTWKHAGQLEDFRAGAAHVCPGCGARFQYVSERAIVETAKREGGDL